MTGLTLPQLLEITPLTEEVKKQALEKLPLMSEGEKFQLQQICWETLMQTCKIRVRAKFEEEIYKTAKEGRDEEIDLAAIEESVLNELLAKIESIHTEEELKNIKKMLHEALPHKYPSTSSDHTKTPSS